MIAVDTSGYYAANKADNKLSLQKVKFQMTMHFAGNLQKNGVDCEEQQNFLKSAKAGDNL